ncbi:MAG TPA: ATP-binding protein [Candidatus Acidoferrales bacterium]|nr:ATP-binding protein [Candidatus Acidoferrales bacterium]
MTFRTSLFIVFTLALLLSIGLVAAGVTAVSRRVFNQMNHQQSDATVAQFAREYNRRGVNVVHRVQTVADAEATVRLAIDLSRPQADVSVYANAAHGVAQSHQLDFLDFVGADGTIISSAEWSARFGHKLTPVTQAVDWATLGSFLMKMDTPQGTQLGLMAVSAVRVGDKNLYIVGGEELGREFLGSLVLPTRMRALLYLNLTPSFEPANLFDQSGLAPQAVRFEPFIEKEIQRPTEQRFEISWTRNAASAEAFHTLPLLGRQKDLLGVLLVGSSQSEVVTLERRILLLALGVVGIGLFLGILLSWWGATGVTRPVRRLAEGVREVSSGNWNARVEVRGRNEIAQLARTFNHMTEQLIEQRERLIQAERVAAWREIARRLAHELKDPLFPLQTAVENLQRAKEQNPDRFEEVFRESTGIVLSEINNLKSIVGRFSDFAKFPQPEFGPVNLNDIVRSILKLFEPQFSAVGRPPITPEVHLDENLPTIQADSTLLHRAIENLVLNAMDAMPAGGVLMLRTTRYEGGVHLEISDTGSGLTPEECQRLFTPYYTTKQHGSGLGLAIVQSVVSDHGGRIWVESETGVGTSFHIELPSQPPQTSASLPAFTNAEGT